MCNYNPFGQVSLSKSYAGPLSLNWNYQVPNPGTWLKRSSDAKATGLDATGNVICSCLSAGIQPATLASQPTLKTLRHAKRVIKYRVYTQFSPDNVPLPLFTRPHSTLRGSMSDRSGAIRRLTTENSLLSPLLLQPPPLPPPPSPLR